MWAMYTFFSLLLVLLMGMSANFGGKAQDNEALTEARAYNFVIYRDAVHRYAFGNPGATGAAPPGSLDLPPGFQPLGTWSNVLESDRVYVYGPLPSGGAQAAARILHQSRAVGFRRAGRLFLPTTGDTGVTLPAYIPEGSTVSVVGR